MWMLINYREYLEPTDLVPTHLPDEVYGQCIQAFQKVCVDVLLVNTSRRVIYLARRVIEPAKDWWWFIGGRVNAGEDYVLAAARHIKTDTSLDLSKERFEGPVAFHHYTFGTRQEEPQNLGCDTPVLVFLAEVNYDEMVLASSHLNKMEYDTVLGLREFSRERLVTKGVHSAIVDIYDQIFPA